jgi:biopolymer transport protein ExbB
MARRILATVLMLFAALPAFGWWNDEWQFRKPIALNTTPNGANLSQPVEDGVVLVRLHMGNFGYFSDTLPNGDDLRFVASDDLTPLPFNVEVFDATNQIALVWVKVGTVQPQSSTQNFFMYYGNSKAPTGGTPSQTYDKAQSLVLHFDNATGAPKDKTAYGNQPSEYSATYESAALIGGGARFDGTGLVKIPASPSLNVQSAKGWTFSAWVRLDQPQQDGTVVEVADAVNGRVALTIRDLTPVLTISANGQAPTEVVASGGLGTETWHHVAAVIDAQRARIYVDGGLAAEGTVPSVGVNGGYTLGARADATGPLAGAVIDEVGVASVARSVDAIALAARGEGMGAALLAFGEDTQKEAGHHESYFITTLRNVTVDGWVVIGLLGVMGTLSWYVMIVKGLVIRRIRTDNARFLKAFYASNQIGDLFHTESPEEVEAQESDLAQAIKGHEGFVSSTLYHLYRTGMKDISARLARGSVGAPRTAVLSGEAINALKASLDATSVREAQRLNNLMVLLTLSVSGGPFLGLLGTVVGVMITFAAIAASGDVNVNAIAPGIAAALVATVAGLGVAIPALFGYNYLGTRIREITSEDRVFLDEFIASIAETYA